MSAIDVIRRCLADAGVDMPDVPKREKPAQIAFVDVHACTGCGLCVPHCPAACIVALPAGAVDDRDPPPVQVRYEECVGCHVCVEICAHLAGPAAIRTYDTNLIEQVLSTEITPDASVAVEAEPWDEYFAEGGGFHHMGEGSQIEALLSDGDRAALASERSSGSDPR